jgi:hypothetical protein
MKIFIAGIVHFDVLGPDKLKKWFKEGLDNNGCSPEFVAVENDSGVGPQQLIDMERIITNCALSNRPILSFSRAKRAFFIDTYGQTVGVGPR